MELKEYIETIKKLLEIGYSLKKAQELNVGEIFNQIAEDLSLFVDELQVYQMSKASGLKYDKNNAGDSNQTKQEKTQQEQKEVGSWYSSDNPPDNERNILVTWINMDGEHSNPIRAYYDQDQNEFFPADSNIRFPLNVARWCELPRFIK